MHTVSVDIAAKLQLKPGQRVAITGAAADEVIALSGLLGTVSDPAAADAVITFVRFRADLATIARPTVAAARTGKLAWLAYPKAGKPGTDLNRDALRETLAGEGVRPVRQVAINDVVSGAFPACLNIRSAAGGKD